MVWADRVGAATCSGRYHILDAKTGRALRSGELPKVDGVAAGLATDGKTLFIPALDGRLFPRDASTGEPLGHVFVLPAGIYATPVVHGGVLYAVDVEGTVAAFDLATKEMRWTATTPTGVRIAPLVLGQRLVILSTAGEVSMLSLRDGKPVLPPFHLEGSFRCPPAVVDENLLVFAAEEGTLYGVRPATGEVLYRRPLEGVRIEHTPPVRAGQIFISPKPGQLIVLDASRGATVYTYQHGQIAARAKAWDKDRICFAHGRTLTVFGPRQDGYVLAWSFEAKGRILAGPVARGDAIFIGDGEGNFYRLEASD